MLSYCLEYKEKADSKITICEDKKRKNNAHVKLCSVRCLKIELYQRTRR